jgi:hypothetical protein
MRTDALQIVVLATALLGAGCDPVFSLQGSVKSPAGAIAGADVTLSCPLDPPVHVTSDALGRLDYHRMGTANPECRLLISKPGFHPKEVRLEDVCRSHFGVACWGAQLDVELAPEG